MDKGLVHCWHSRVESASREDNRGSGAPSTRRAETDLAHAARTDDRYVRRPMRQLTPITNLLLAICFAALSVFALTTPWYAIAEAPSGAGEGAMEAIADDVYQF